MIITKSMENISGYIEYSYRPEEHEIEWEGISEDDLDCMFDSDTFNSLSELVDKMQDSVLQEIRDEYSVKNVWVSSITFKGVSEDTKTFSNITMGDSFKRGHVATDVENKDIDSRLLLNLEKVRKIVDNTLEQYPIKY